MCALDSLRWKKVKFAAHSSILGFTVTPRIFSTRDMMASEQSKQPFQIYLARNTP